MVVLFRIPLVTIIVEHLICLIVIYIYSLVKCLTMPEFLFLLLLSYDSFIRILNASTLSD